MIVLSENNMIQPIQQLIFFEIFKILQRDSEEPLLDLWPFAVEASNFRELWVERMRPVKEQVCQYLMWRKSRPENKISAEVEEKVENAIQVIQIFSPKMPLLT